MTHWGQQSCRNMSNFGSLIAIIYQASWELSHTTVLLFVEPLFHVVLLCNCPGAVLCLQPYCDQAQTQGGASQGGDACRAERTHQWTGESPGRKCRQGNKREHRQPHLRNNRKEAWHGPWLKQPKASLKPSWTGACCFRLRCSPGVRYIRAGEAFENCSPQSKAGRVISTLSPAPGGISVWWHSMPSLFLDDINQKPAAISLFDNERCTHDGIYFCCVPCKCSGLCHNMVLIKLLKITLPSWLLLVKVFHII